MQTKRRAVRFVIVGQKFVFEFGHIHVGRAFGLATFALEAKIERFVEIMAGEFIQRKLSRQNLAHQVGAATRGMLVVERHHV